MWVPHQIFSYVQKHVSYKIGYEYNSWVGYRTTQKELGTLVAVAGIYWRYISSTIKIFNKPSLKKMCYA